MSVERTCLEVWGDPIAHSRSPQLHAAAYAVMGVPWTYGRRQVGEAAFAPELAGLDASHRGLSLTMPLKHAARAAAVWLDPRAAATGAVNTLLLDSAGSGPRGWNTDVGGIVRALADAGVTSAARARIIGAGATATSALVALIEIGATEIDVYARRPESVDPLVEVGAQLGAIVRASALHGGDRSGDRGTASGNAASVDAASVTIATIPGTAAVDRDTADDLAAAGGVLLDVAYGHGETALSNAWERAGYPVLPGEGMLLHQALLQVRIFANGDVDAELANEADVLAAMRSALVGG